MPRLDERYIDENGREWGTYQDYCNSDVPDFDVICVMLETGRRIPQNDWERDFVAKHKKYKAAGIATEHPFD